MANLPGSGQLSMNDINTYLSTGGGGGGIAGQKSLLALESHYMTGATSSIYQNALAGICMPGQVEVTKNTGNTTIGSGGRNYTGASGDQWRSSRISEFYAAHGYYGLEGNGKPRITGAAISPSGSTNTGYANVTFDRGLFSGEPVFILIKTTGGAVHYGWGQFNSGSQTGNIAITRSVYYTAFIRDNRGCGLNLEFKSATNFAYLG